MPAFVTVHGRRQANDASPADQPGWSDAIQATMYDLATDIYTGGGSVVYSYPYVKVLSFDNLDHFTGGSFQGLWGIFPPDYAGFPADDRPIPLIVDEVPPGFVPDPPFFIGGITGGDALLAHKKIVEAIINMDDRLKVIPSTAIGFGDPAEPRYNTFLYYKIPPIPFPAGPVANRIPTPQPAVALNTNSGLALNGGYTCGVGGSLIQIEMDSRDQNTYIRVSFSKSPFGFPAEVFSREGIDRTAFFFLRLDSARWRIATGPGYLYVASCGDALSGAGNEHLEVAAVILPDINTGTFAVGGANGEEATFKKGLQCSGTYCINMGGQTLLSQEGGSGSINVPRVMALWLDRADGLWENGLAQITEAWVGFADDLGKPGAICGKLPNALVANGIFDPDADSPRDFDNKMWVPYGYGTQDSVCLFMKTDDDVIPGDCP